jgi:hypothetical protein
MSAEAYNLRRRAEKLLGWKEGESNIFSLPTLRDIVRSRSPASKLYYLLSECIRTGRHIHD